MLREGDQRNLIPVVSFEMIYLPLLFLTTWPLLCILGSFKISLYREVEVKVGVGVFFPGG